MTVAQGDRVLDKPTTKEAFERDGFVILSDLFLIATIERFEAATVRLGRHLLGKAGVTNLPTHPLEMFRFCESKHPEIFYQLCSTMGGTLPGYELVSNEKSLAAIAEIDGGATVYFPTVPGMFWNDRSVKRLQYDWHQETSYFGDIKNTLTIWFPLFRDVSSEDGPMLMAAGSHHKIMEYEIEKKERSLIQLRILDNIESTPIANIVDTCL
jgi:hypothetical protein